MANQKLSKKRGRKTMYKTYDEMMGHILEIFEQDVHPSALKQIKGALRQVNETQEQVSKTLKRMDEAKSLNEKEVEEKKLVLHKRALLKAYQIIQEYSTGVLSRLREVAANAIRDIEAIKLRFDD